MVSRSGKTDAAAPSTTDPLDEETVLVGQVLRPHGLRGEVKIEVLSDVEERFAPGRELWLISSAGAHRRVRIASFRAGSKGALIRLSGWHSREQAEELRGSRFEVGLSEVPAAPDGLFYHHELIGCVCFDEHRGRLGEVVDVVEDGGGELLEVERTGGGRVLVPFVEAFAVDVDVEAREIRLRLPPGLLETCGS